MFFGYLYTTMPTLLGSSVMLLWCRLHLVMSRGRAFSMPELILYSGVGGFLGNLLVALLVGWLDRAGLQVFSPRLLLGLTVLTLCSVAILIWSWPNGRRFRFRNWCVSDALLVLLSFSVCLHVFYQVWLLPVASWDALGHWVSWAQKFLFFDLSGEIVEERSRANGDAWHWIHPRHPPTVFHSSAFSAYSLIGTDRIGWLSSWSAIWACCAGVMWGFVRATGGSSLQGGLALVAFLTLPLLENHAIAVGYADLWVLVAVTMAAALVAYSLVFGTFHEMVLGMGLAFTPMLMKNTGVLYTFAILMPAALVPLIAKWPKSTLFYVTLLLLALLLFLMIEPDIIIFGQRFSLQFSDNAVVIFGGYTLPLEFYSPAKIAANTLWALVINQSFSTSAVLLTVVAVVLVCELRSVREGACKVSYRFYLASWFLFLSAFFTITCFMVPQLVAEYAIAFAQPSEDIGNSRFILPFSAITLLALGVLPRVIEPKICCGAVIR